jgi:triosephosphate isomerase (TIM)
MLLVENWKAYVESLEKAKRLYRMGKRLAGARKHEIVLAPPMPYLGYLASGNRSRLAFAAQDLSAHAGGAATGETTASMLASLKVGYAILGHSERRSMGENDALVLAKVQLALASGLTPILCIGERTRDPEARYLAHLRSQLDAIFIPLSPKERARLVIAYEPIWAIGKSAEESITPPDLTEMVLYLRKLLGEYLTSKGASSARILYGGSVEPGNIRALSLGTGIDGFLIGHASTDGHSFGALVKALA